MPFVTVKLIAGVFDAGQKRAIIERITDVMVAMEGETIRPVVWVVIEEVLSGDWGVGGRCVDTATIRAIRDGELSVRDAIGA